MNNPWFPLTPGSTYRYRGTKDGKAAVEDVRVTRRTKRILGVRNVVVRDRLYLNGRLAEDTTDWYSRTARATVWYFGEATATFDARGRVESREGSFVSAKRTALRTTERTPLEPKVLDAKYYVRGIGTVKELQVKGPGPREHLELVSFRR